MRLTYKLGCKNSKNYHCQAVFLQKNVPLVIAYKSVFESATCYGVEMGFGGWHHNVS